MRVLIEMEGRRETVEIGAISDGATVGELIEAATGVSPAAEIGFFIDGSSVDSATPLADVILLEGSRVSGTPERPPGRIVGWSVTLAGGLEASRVVELPKARRLIIGRSPQADIVLPSESASWEHCSFEREGVGVLLRDAGSTNGTVVGGERVSTEGILVIEATSVIVGGDALLLRPQLEEKAAPAPGTLPNLTPAGTAPFNRPPRPGRAGESPTVLTPSRKDVPPASKFSLLTIAAPLLMAGAMVLLLGDARFALFAVLSPVTAIGMWFEQRHRRGRNLREEEERFAKGVIELRREVVSASHREAERRRAHAPDPATASRRASHPTTLLWQRRADDEDVLALSVGVGDVPWRPDVDDGSTPRREVEVEALLAASRLTAAPVLADLSNAGVVGIVGDRDGARALARSLVTQAAVHCGPADLAIGVFCDAGRDDDWSWSSWLPHTRIVGSGTGARWMSWHREQSAHLLRSLRETLDDLPAPHLLVVIDSEHLTEGRDAPARSLLGTGRVADGIGGRPKEGLRRVSGIVLAESEQQLPASCTTIVTVGADAAATVSYPEQRTTVDDVVIAGIGIRAAERCARDLARLDDPEVTVPGASLPSLVRLPRLLDDGARDARAVLSAWDAATGLSTPIGLSETGPLVLDLVRDGPHGLVGGTTGSGKSEFLRSLVAGLAARNDPSRLNFILVDFKGGAAFATCERLPHTIGTISNLDAQLADRAIRSLEAEMRRRQRIFAAAGPDVDSLDAYLATRPAESMPRLLLVVDEFAMLAKDFPEVLTSLVSIAAVGRTLGVHMILATQRPAGVVSEDILANTNLRVALRVQSRDDSLNVIGVASAAEIGRQQSGRAYIKLGQNDITPVQTALVTGSVEGDASEVAVAVRPTDAFGVPATPERRTSATSEVTDLDELIDAITIANALAGYAPPRPIWPEALGERVALHGFSDDAETAATVGGSTDDLVAIALADEPDLQRQSSAGWRLDEGNLLLVGLAGSGTSTALASTAFASALQLPPDRLDIMVLDLGSGDLACLDDLPHTTAYIGSGAGGREQQARFLRHLRAEIERRGSAAGPHRRILVLIDGLAALRDEFGDYEGQELLDGLYRAYADGPALGMHFAVSCTRAKAVPSTMDEVTTQKWLFRLADPYDYAAAGVRAKDIPPPVPGRFVDAATSRQMHVATPARSPKDAVGHVRAAWPLGEVKASVVGFLPDEVQVGALEASPSFVAEPWRIPLGVAEDDLTPAFLEVYAGEHVVVAGPARSGKSTLLLALVESIRTATGDRPAVWAICDRRSPLAQADVDRLAVGAAEIPELVAALRLEKGPVILLVDDAERFDDADQVIASLLAVERPGLCLIAAGRAADLRSLYGHWTKAVRKSRCGVLLQPDVDYDGDLLGVALPRRAPVALTAGRGYASSGGRTRLVQAMTPSVG